MMKCISVLVVVGFLLSGRCCDAAGVRRLARRRKVLPASGENYFKEIISGMKVPPPEKLRTLSSTDRLEFKDIAQCAISTCWASVGTL